MSSRAITVLRRGQARQNRRLDRHERRLQQLSRSQSVITRSVVSSDYQSRSEKGRPNGYVPLDLAGKIPETYIDLPDLQLEGNYALRAEVPSLEEIVWQTTLAWRTGVNANTLQLAAGQSGTAVAGMAPYPLRINYAHITFTQGRGAADSWVVSLIGNNGSGSTGDTIASFTTGTVGLMQPLAFDPLNATHRQLAAGEVLLVSLAPAAATPNAGTLGVGFLTVGYARV